MVTEMTCYTYLGHIRNPRIYAVPPNYAVFTRFYFHPKNRVKWGEYCTTVKLRTSDQLRLVKNAKNAHICWFQIKLVLCAHS